LRRRAAEGRMAGMWELPTRERGSEHLFRARWPLADRCALLREGTPLAELRHTITHHRIRLVLRRGELAREPRGADWRWVALARSAEFPLTGMARKALRTLRGSAAARA
ncbi:MAG TPA: NUDIX domain-containing protein, partial [Myxococcota bacterium]|nr:NUDIX domain-containing protein [Myxococcota bacterium]